MKLPSMPDRLPLAGIYQHYKTKQLYEVLASAIHSETREEMVIYKSLYDCPEFGSHAIWVRPKAMFLENVTHEGSNVPRFKWIKKTPQPD